MESNLRETAREWILNTPELLVKGGPDGALAVLESLTALLERVVAVTSRRLG